MPAQGRTLLTNGHPMSSTSPLSQRYMRALAHIPLLSMDHPETVLVIGFGVGNTTHAATLHPSIRRVEVADLSRGILDHAGYFDDVNRDVLNDPRVAVYVNDGRQHLQMQPPASYDLITLEPPPIGYAGVAALYSREFYALARTRLKPGGYRQPVAAGVPGAGADDAGDGPGVRRRLPAGRAALGRGSRPAARRRERFAHRDRSRARWPARSRSAPAVQADLQRLDLGTPREIVGTFVGSAQTLAEATRDVAPVSDDRPIQEYGVRSLLDFGEAVPASIVDLRQVAAWCPACFVGGKPVPLVEGLDTYLALVGPCLLRRRRLEVARAPQPGRAAGPRDRGQRVPRRHRARIRGRAQHRSASRSPSRGRMDEAIAEFREALRLDPDSAQTHWHLGAALAYRGARDEAVEHLRESVQLDPSNVNARHDLDVRAHA